MKPKHIRVLLVTIAAATLFCWSARATAILTEPFVGYADGRLGDTGVGGSGTVPGWYTAQNQITVTNSLGSLDAEALGLVAAFGAKVRISNAGITNQVISILQ